MKVRGPVSAHPSWSFSVFSVFFFVVLQCAKLCDNSPDCEGFSHHGLYKRCQIHTQEGEEIDLNDHWTTYQRSQPAGE